MSTAAKDPKNSNSTPRSINPGPSKPDLAGVDSSSISGQSVSTSGRAYVSEGETDSPKSQITRLTSENQHIKDHVARIESGMLSMQEQMHQLTMMFKQAMPQVTPQGSTVQPIGGVSTNPGYVLGEFNTTPHSTGEQMKAQPDERTFRPESNFPSLGTRSLASPLPIHSHQSGTPRSYGSSRSIASYDGILYRGEVVHDGFWVEGHEAACEIINEARQKYPHGEDVEVIPYIRVPNLLVEKAFMAYYNKLVAKQGRTQNDIIALGQYDISKRVPMKFSDVDGFMFWLKEVLWHKHIYGIPDKLIINELKTAANVTKSKALIAMIDTECKSDDPFEQPMISYLPILHTRKVAPVQNQVFDIIGKINDTLKEDFEVKMKMTIIGIAIKKNMNANKSTKLSLETWINIFKTLFEKMGKVMSMIIQYMHKQITVEYIGENGIMLSRVEDATDIKQGLTLLRDNSTDQIMYGMKFYDLTFERIWEVVNVTFRDTLPMIGIEEAKNHKPVQSEKSEKLQKTTSCHFCGGGRHKLDKCYTMTAALEEGLVKKKDGKYYLADDKPLNIDGKQPAVQRYPDLKNLKTNARHRTAPN